MNKKIIKINFSPLDNGFFRLRGFSGLGNLLCTWGEAMLLAKKNGGQVVWPTWPQLSLSAIKYNRTYFHVFKNNGKYLPFWKYVLLTLRKNFINQNVLVSGPKIPYNVDWSHSGNPVEDAAWLRQNLIAIITPAYNKRIRQISTRGNFIGLHIRRGDFLNPLQHFKDGGGREVNKAIELVWFIQAIEIVRSAIGNLPVVCISDAKEEDLKSILSIENVQMQTEHPVVDILTISRASGFIASGSTFSQWISYLGGMDTWINKDHTWYGPEHLKSKLHHI